MKFITVLAFLFSQSTVFAAKAAKDLSMKLDPAASSITWKGQKKIVKSEHVGNIALKSGTFKVKGNMESLTGEVVADMNSISNTDLTDAEYNKKLVGHLKNEDFFATDKFPTATLKIKKMVIGQNFAPGQPNADVEGEVTIKGKTKPVTFKATFTPNAKDHSFVANGALVLDRTDFDVKYGSDKFFQNLGDKVIDDKFTLDFKIVAKK